MKSLLKKILVKILGWQVRRLRRKNNFKIIGVVGSIGKTSTKLAIAKVLRAEKECDIRKVIITKSSVCRWYFSAKRCRRFGIFSHGSGIIIRNEFQIYSNIPYDIVVVELGTDAPGQIAEFRRYLHLNIAVITATTAEHMEFFENIENVVEEEWSVRFFSNEVFANRDLCANFTS